MQEQPKQQKKIVVKSVKHIAVKTGIRAGAPQDGRSSKNANNGGGP